MFQLLKLEIKNILSANMIVNLIFFFIALVVFLVFSNITMLNNGTRYFFLLCIIVLLPYSWQQGKDADIFEYGLTFPVKRKKLFIVATIAEFIIEFIVIALVLMAVICLLFSSISLSLKYCTVCLVLMFIATVITKTFSFSMLSRSMYYFLLLLFVYIAMENNWFVLHFGKVLMLQLLFLGTVLFCGLKKWTKKEVI